MYLHVEWKDGSNPYIVYGSKDVVMKAYRWFNKQYGKEISVLFGGNGLQCRKDCVGNWCVSKWFDGAHTTKQYSRLGYALNRLKDNTI